MATVDILVPGPPPAAHRKVTIVAVAGGASLTVPLLSEIGVDNASSRWSIQDRPGREPMTVWGGPGAVGAHLKIRVGNGDLVTSAEAALLSLRTLTLGSQPIVVACGQFSRWSWTGAWVITSMSVDNELLIQGSNEVAQAEATLNLAASMTPTQIRTTDR